VERVLNFEHEHQGQGHIPNSWNAGKRCCDYGKEYTNKRRKADCVGPSGTSGRAGRITTLYIFLS
jgi:hypothetical protein